MLKRNLTICRRVLVSACEVGRWGVGCANTCDKSCPNCDHRTGCCKTAATGSSIFCGGGGGSIGGAGHQTAVASGARNDTSRKIDDAVMASAVADSLARFRILSTTIRLQTATWEPAGNEANETTRTTEVTSTRKPATTQNRSAAADTAWTPLEATALKYDELVTRLIWIFAMTLVAIAMVFVVMFVVFFKCYGTTASKPQTDARPTRNPWPERSTGKVRGTQYDFLSITDKR